MENKTLQEVADELMDFPGKTKGESVRTHAEYIKHKEGEEGLKRLEERMAELGAPIKYKEINPFEWVKEGLCSLTVIVAKEVFNWTDEDVFEMGSAAPKMSFIIRILARHFISPEKIFKEAEKIWKKHYDFGSFNILEVNEDKKRICFNIEGFKAHPLICLYREGYFKAVAQFTIKSSEISIEEVKCVHEGDDFHEYLITWK